MSEMCCTWLAEITGRNNYAKKSPSGHHRTILSGYIFATNAHINNRKNLLNRNISPTCPCPHNMTNFGLLAAEIGLGVLGNPPPREFQRVSRLAFASAATSLTGGLPNFVRCFAAPGLVHYVYIFAYIASVTAWHSSSGCQPNFVSWHKEWNYRTFAEAPRIFGWVAITLGQFLVMAALRSRCGHCTLVLLFLSFFLSFFFFFFFLWPPCVADADIIFLPCGFYLLLFLALYQRSQTGCPPYFHTWCGLSANLGCRSETCCKGSLKIQDTKMC